MNILNIVSALSYGGAETQVINLSNEFARQGHSVILISLSNHNPRIEELDRSLLDVRVEAKRVKIDFEIIRRIRKIIRQWKPDVVHSYLYDADFFVRLSAIGTNTPVINSERSDNYKLNCNQKIGNFLTSKLVSAVIANSYSGRDFAKTHFKQLPDDSFHVIWNGIDLDHVGRRLECDQVDYRQSLFGSNLVKLACMVANVKPVKDHLLALRVAQRLVRQDPQWRVLFVGGKGGDQGIGDSGEYVQSVEEAHNSIDEKEKILFLGSRTDVLEILRQTDVSFLTSYHEGFPNAVLESMAVGTPAVSTEFSDIRRVLPQPWMVVANRDPVDLSNAILRAYKEKTWLSNQGVDWVAENCSLESIVKKHIEIYKKCKRS